MKASCVRLAPAMACAFAVSLVSGTLLQGAGSGTVMAAGAAATVLLFAVYLCMKRSRRPLSESTLALCFVGILGLIFVWRMPYDFSWHDLGAWEITATDVGDGHFGYIRWIVERGLPLQNPMTEGNSILYHPPLFHLLSAALYKAQCAVGLDEAAALENLQIIPFLSAFGFAWCAGALVRELGDSDRAQAFGILLCGCLPIVPLLGATPNNDMLMLFWIALCTLLTLRWLRSGRMRDIIGMGLTLGMGMATKLNAALLIPGIGLIFVIVFFREKRKGRLIGQYAAFLGCSVPEAVAWPLYHLIAYQMPLTYVRYPAETLDVSGRGVWAMFGIPNGDAIRKLFYTGIRKTDHNVWMQTLKTAMFDEQTLFEEGTWQWYAAYLLMAGVAVILLCCAVGLIVRLCKKGTDGLPRLFIAVCTAVFAFSYINFCRSYPYICTFNFRYALCLMPLLAVGGAWFWDHRRKWVRIVSCACSVLMAVGVSACYGLWFIA